MSQLGELIVQLLTMSIRYLIFWAWVNHYEECIVLRWGKYSRTLGPGIHFKVPVAEYGLTVNVMPDTMEIHAINITTNDKKTILIGMYIEYQIVDSKLFMIENNDSITNMQDIARGEMSDFLEDCIWEDIKKKTAKNALMKNIQKKFEKMGIKVLSMSFTHKAEGKVFTFYNPSMNIFNHLG